MAYEFASRLETFPKYRKFETTFAGRPFVVETGKMCGLSNGSAMIRYGETCVLCIRQHKVNNLTVLTEKQF